MKLGFIIPTYLGEKRVALLPEHIKDFKNEIIIENGFGKNLDIDDVEYINKGCKVYSREQIFKECNAIFCLKLLQPEDYPLLRKGQLIIGWTHPLGSGKIFFNTICQEKELAIVDLDNIYPRLYYKDKVKEIDFIPKNFIWKNSFNAGYSATIHALVNFGLIPKSFHKVAILASGSVSQGAYYAMANFNPEIRMFYRKTMNEFYNQISEFDIIINGIEVDTEGLHIIDKQKLSMIKDSALIIDAAADAGNAIEGTRFTPMNNPIYKENSKYFYLVNNAPSVFYRQSSFDISDSFSKYVYRNDVKRFLELL